MDIACEIEGVNIALVGAFNPRIFQPAWFAHHGLIRYEEAEVAETIVTVNELSTFTADWLTLQVTTERFEASTADAAHFDVLRDLVVGTFQILEHTPVNRMGINRNMHYRVTPVEKYIAFGHFLVPKRPHWAELLSDPRTISVSVAGTQLRGPEKVVITVKVEPSVRIDPGVFISTNEDYKADTDRGILKLLTELKNNWETAQTMAKQIAEKLLRQEY